MQTIFSILLVIFLSLFLFVSTGVVEEVQSGWSPAMTGETLIIDGEDALRLATTTPGASDAYVASASSLFHTSGDGAWERVGAAPPPGEIVFDAQNPAVLMVGDEEMCARGGGGAPLHISTDGGATWSSAPDAPRVKPLAISSDTGLVGGATCRGFEISLDMGATWNVVAESQLGMQVTVFSVIEGGNHQVLVGFTGEGGTGQLYKVDLSDPANPVLSDSLLMYYGLGAAAGTTDTLYLATIAGLAVSHDGGQTWDVQRDGLETVTVAEDPVTHGLPIDFEPDTYGLYALLLKDGGAAVLGTENGVFVAQDDGTWTPLIQPGSAFTSLQYLPGNQAVLAQGDDFVWVVYPA